jgi:hypothetical protein
MARILWIAIALSTASACDTGGAAGADASSGDASRDASFVDASADGASLDGAGSDGGARDASAIDVGVEDAAAHDASFDADVFHDAYIGLDAPVPDTGIDAFLAPDAFLPVDAFTIDAFTPTDTGVDASSSGACISGVTGTHVLRFRWAGSGAGSTAYVVYEANTLPDTSRWHVSAASMSIGYTPRFDDVFLGEGGLDLSGTTFIDVQLSTAGLSSISNVSIGIYGRSFATTSSGSFSWQTFSGMSATPSNSVANSAPYAWYRGDATAAFVPGDSAVLLRLRAGPSSSALIVNRVEVCLTGS